MRFLSTNAIVLRSLNQGEADRLVIIYTEARGKLSALAKGARKPKNSLAPLTQLFAYSHFLLVKGKTFYIITQGRLKHSFLSIIEDMERFAFASSIVELIDRMTEEGEADKDVFDNLLAHLYVMERAKDPELIARSWELKLLSHLGYKPELENCIICGRKVEGNIFFSPSNGGVICSKCTISAPDCLFIRQKPLEYLKNLLKTPVHLLKGEELPSDIKEELRSIILPYIDLRAGKKGKTESFLREISES
ncbi:DNA repair protein RecO [bacterium]|nr:DNA repair protein RecO [bacterium]